MKTLLKNALKTYALSVVLAVSIHSAQAAQIAHTYVSGAAPGSDSNPCTRTSPCATFQGALTNTSPGGVITAVDAGDYGQVAITQSVTIDGTGTQASIVTNSTTNAITISASQGTVILRNLTLTGLSGSGNGIGLTSGSLTVEGCKISGFNNSAAGLFDNTFSGSLTVVNTSITGCTVGINIVSSGLASLRNVTLIGNSNGLSTQSGGATDISHSLITQCIGNGLIAFGSGSTLSVSNCVISGNYTGVSAEGGGLIRLTGNDIFNNTIGINTSILGGGTVSTAGNNRKAGNATSGAPTPGKIITVQ